MSFNYVLDFYGANPFQTVVSIPNTSQTSLNINGFVTVAISSADPAAWQSDDLPAMVRPITPVTQMIQLLYVENGVEVHHDAELVYDGKISITCLAPLSPGINFSCLSVSVPFDR